MATNKLLSVLLYARVSTEVQAEGNAVSVEQQLLEMRKLCDHRNWKISGEYLDFQNYTATLPPKKGRIVNPSGERADRPNFLLMLEEIKSGQFDVVMCWRDDRLVRHPRVEVALEDALDIGDIKRKGQDKIQIVDATGAVIDRFTLSIKASVWREENKRRAERGKMGKKATLLAGRWSGEYRRYGYRSIKEPGQRGRVIEIDPETAPIIKRIFELYDGGYRIVDIRQYLIENEVSQFYPVLVKHQWSRPLIDRILKSEEYLGEATWRFGDGTEVRIKIPTIIEPELWKRVQERFERNKRLSPRNTKGIYLLQGVLYCGECLHQLSITHCKGYGSFKFGEGNSYAYRCPSASENPHEAHPKPSSFNGLKLDWALWRFVLDDLLPNPQKTIDLIMMQVEKLQVEGDDADGEISQIELNKQNILKERAFYQKKASQGKIDESEFDQRMDETSFELERLNNRLAYLLKLRHDAELVQRSLDYVRVVFVRLVEKSLSLDVSPNEFHGMADDQQGLVMRGKRTILRMIIERGFVFPNQEIKLFCKIDGSEIIPLGIQGS